MSLKFEPGIIGFEHFKIRCVIGVNPEERTQEQDVFIDVKVEIDFSSCCATDDLSQTINYESLAAICVDLAKKNHFQLIETFAYRALERFHQEFNINWAWIKIKKPHALSGANFTFVELKSYESHA